MARKGYGKKDGSRRGTKAGAEAEIKHQNVDIQKEGNRMKKRIRRGKTHVNSNTVSNGARKEYSGYRKTRAKRMTR